MRQRRWLDWLGACVLSYGLLAGTLMVFSAVPLLWASRATAADEDLDADKAKASKAEEKGATDTIERKNFLSWLVGALGWRYTIIFLIITFCDVALFVMNIIAVWRDNVVPPILVQEFENHLNEKRYQEAYDLAKNDGSFLGRVLAAGLAKLSAGYDEALAAMQTVGEEENTKMEHRLGYVALCAQIAPMFGLLGTVDGMVIAFDVIANSNVTPKPSELAQGIGMALVTTVVGLWIAIPSIVYHHFVKNRLIRLVGEAGIISEDLMKRFSAVGTAAKKP